VTVNVNGAFVNVNGLDSQATSVAYDHAYGGRSRLLSREAVSPMGSLAIWTAIRRGNVWSNLQSGFASSRPSWLQQGSALGLDV